MSGQTFVELGGVEPRPFDANETRYQLRYSPVSNVLLLYADVYTR